MKSAAMRSVSDIGFETQSSRVPSEDVITPSCEKVADVDDNCSGLLLDQAST